jgi:hypothetical protein
MKFREKIQHSLNAGKNLQGTNTLAYHENS